MNSPILQASFRKRFNPQIEIQVNDLNLPAGGTTVLFGPSGAGKTTILRCLAGLEIPDAGRIQFKNEIWFDHEKRRHVKPAQRQIGFVPQSYALFPHLTVSANIAYGLHGQPVTGISARVAEIMDWLALSELADRLPTTLSGGQQQRVALARALARKPALALLDEPLSALDQPARHRLRSELRETLRRFHCPVLLVTHDRLDAAVLGDRIVVVSDGKILQQGIVPEVFNHPAHLSVAHIVGTDTVLPCQILRVTDELATLAVGTAQLTAVYTSASNNVGPAHVCIRAEDVVLARNADIRMSARNQLPAIIQNISDEGMMLRIDLDCGFPLKALLTRQACVDLKLKPGETITAMIKAPQIHII